MISKIDPKLLSNPKGISHSISSLPLPRSEFNLVLQGKLSAYKPLEMIVIGYLCRALDSVLSMDTSEKTNSFFPLPLPMEPSFQFSPKEKQVQQTQPTSSPDEPGPEAMAEVSNNSRRSQDFEKIIEKAGHQYGVEAALIRAVILVESGGDPLAVSSAGAQGLMQLMPGTAHELGVRDPFDPGENIMAGTRYLRQLLNRYRGNIKLALAAYNWGMGNLEKRPGALPKETQNFIVRVENHYRTFSKSSQSA